VGTVITLGRRVSIGIHVKGIIGTSLHTGFTSDAAIVIKINNTISTSMKRSGGANFNTRRIGTMVASMDGKFSSGIWESPLFNIFHMGAIHTDGNIMLTFASHCAGMASDTHAVIYYKSVIHISCHKDSKTQKTTLFKKLSYDIFKLFWGFSFYFIPINYLFFVSWCLRG